MRWARWLPLRNEVTHRKLDNAMHTEFLAKFNSKVDQDGLDLDERDDQILTLQIALHAADVSNAAKPTAIAKEWTRRVVTEFFAQVQSDVGTLAEVLCR